MPALSTIRESTVESGPTLPRDGKSELTLSRKLQLAWLLLPAATSRLKYRFLKSTALGIAASQVMVYFTSDAVVPAQALRLRLITTTLLYCLILGLLAAWVLLSGFWDRSVPRLFDALRRRRGFPAHTFAQLETIATSLWLTLLLTAPLVAVALLAVARARQLLELLGLLSALAQAIVVVALYAQGVAWLTLEVRRLEWRYPRSLFLVLLIVPELLRLMSPELPTVRTLLWELAASIPVWRLPS